jgi:hypothetical protein
MGAKPVSPTGAIGALAEDRVLSAPRGRAHLEPELRLWT